MDAANILTLLLGATLTAIGGLIGRWLEARREHSRWLRDARQDAYTSLIAVLTRGTTLLTVDQDDDEHLAALLKDMQEPMAAVELVGPSEVITAAVLLQRTTAPFVKPASNELATYKQEFSLARQLFLSTASNTLGTRKKGYKRKEAERIEQRIKAIMKHMDERAAS